MEIGTGKQPVVRPFARERQTGICDDGFIRPLVQDDRFFVSDRRHG